MLVHNDVPLLTASDFKVVLDERELVVFRRQIFGDWNKPEILEFGDYYVLFLQHHRSTRALPVLSHCLHLLSHLSELLSPLLFYSNIVSLGEAWELGPSFYLLFVQPVTLQCPRWSGK